MLGAVVILAVAFAGGTLTTPLYPIYQRVQGFSQITLTLVFGAYVIGTLAVLVGLGRVSDQIGRRVTALAGLGAGAVGTVVFLIFPESTAALFVGRVASGLSVGLVTGAATAWIAELHPRGDRAAAALVAAVGNVLGIGLGPLLSGVIADVAPAPLRLPFVAFAMLVAGAVVVAVRLRETVERAVPVRALELRPRFGVPREIRSRFVAPSLAGASIFAVFGFYSAIAPSFLGRELGHTSHALAGAIVLELCLSAVGAILISRRRSNRTAMLGGLAVLIAGLAIVVIAEETRSFAVFVIATAVTGLGFGPGYRGSLEALNLIAPAERRAEVISSYFIFCYLGLSVPIVGIGLASAATSLATASTIFAATVALLALVALVLGARTLPRDDPATPPAHQRATENATS